MTARNSAVVESRPAFMNSRTPDNREGPLVTRRKSTVILLAGLLGICLILAGLILRAFWRPIIFASVIGIGFYPLHERINKLVRRQNASALLSTLFVLLIFVVPAAFVASAGSGDIIHAAQYLNSRSGPGVSIFSNLSHSADRLVRWLENYVDLEKSGLRSFIDSLPTKMSELLFAIAASLVSGLASFLGQGVITLFILFFVFRDGATTTTRVASLLPLARDRSEHLFAEIRKSVFANLYGILAVAFAQGLLTGAAFAILGIPSPVLFGIVAAVFSLVPLVGPSLVWLPATAFLFFGSHWMKGIFLLAWGALVVGTADNIIRPLVIMGRVKLHPVVLLFALVGGVQQFGFIGLFVGPVVMSLIIALVDMLQQEAQAVREKLATP
jgi:predicted PurR-regulated permease PerM